MSPKAYGLMGRIYWVNQMYCMGFLISGPRNVGWILFYCCLENPLAFQTVHIS